MEYAVLDELLEWWLDCIGGNIESRLLLLEAPHDWGKTTLLTQFEDHISESESDVWLVSIDATSTPPDSGLLIKYLDKASGKDPAVDLAADLLTLDTPEGAATLAAGIAALTISPALAGPLGLAVAMGLGAERAIRSKLYPDLEGLARRAGGRLARASLEAPVVLVLDAAEEMEPSIADGFLSGAIDHKSSRVLAVVAAAPNSELVSRLTSRQRFDLVSQRFRRLEVTNASMSANDRRELCRQLAPFWPESVVDRLVVRTRTFAEVRRLSEIAGARDVSSDPDPVGSFDRLADLVLSVANESAASVLLAWCGGVLHEQEFLALARMEGWEIPLVEDQVIVGGGIARLVQPADIRRLRERVELYFNRQDRNRMAELIANVAEKVVKIETDPFLRAAAVRCIPRFLSTPDPPDLPATESTLHLFTIMIGLLCDAGDLAAAGQLADQSIELAQACTTSGGTLDRLIAQRLTIASLGGETAEVSELASSIVDGENAVFGIEARAWATLLRLQDRNARSHSIDLANALEPELDSNVFGRVVQNLRFQLGIELLQLEAAEPALRMLGPLLLLSERDPLKMDSEVLLQSAHGPATVWIAGIVSLERDLAATPTELSEDRLGLVSALADLYVKVGDSKNALLRGEEAARLCFELLGPDHINTLVARSEFANITYKSGSIRRALDLDLLVLADAERVVGHYHLLTLQIRSNTALWIGDLGDPQRALRLLPQLLSDVLRELGPDNELCLQVQAHIALFTSRCGDHATALAILKNLLPMQERCPWPRPFKGSKHSKQHWHHFWCQWQPD